jgi:hypothetical protein
MAMREAGDSVLNVLEGEDARSCGPLERSREDAIAEAGVVQPREHRSATEVGPKN